MYAFYMLIYRVLVPPELVEGPGQVEGIEGEEEVIRCNASGFPKPTFSFFKVFSLTISIKRYNMWLLILIQVF